MPIDGDATTDIPMKDTGSPLAARSARGVAERDPRKEEGAGNAGCWPQPMARLQKRKQAAVTTGPAGHPAFPARWALRLIRDLPGAPGFLATIPTRSEASTRVDISIGMPGPHDFNVRERPRTRATPASRRSTARGRPTSLVLTTPSQPPHPAPRVVTTRTPLLPGRNGADIAIDLGSESRQIPKNGRRVLERNGATDRNDVQCRRMLRRRCDQRRPVCSRLVGAARHDKFHAASP